MVLKKPKQGVVMDKRFIAILIAVVAVMIGVFALSGGKSGTSNATFEGDPTQVQADDWAQGPADAKVTLIEYGDFQCPGCAALFPALEQVKQELGNEFRFIFRHFPLTSIHPNAMAAHRAAEAAGLQGKFWEMHNQLYQTQQVWSGVSNAPELFEGYAQELGLDMDKYRTDIASQTVFDQISKFQDSGNQLGLTSTPSLLLNGEVIPNPATIDDLRQLIQSAIDATNGS
ncbi:MAG TPA: thioredoxin domain-containing protein [Candidatus Saccharimonadales bacterium]